jgi:hypothetical protein
MIDGAETGCVNYTKEALSELGKKKFKKHLLVLLELAYQVQHYTYFALSEAEIVAKLLSIYDYVENGKEVVYEADAKVITQFLDSCFFYNRQMLSATSIAQIMQTTAAKEKQPLIEQFLVDVINSYADYRENLEECFE